MIQFVSVFPPARSLYLTMWVSCMRVNDSGAPSGRGAFAPLTQGIGRLRLPQPWAMLCAPVGGVYVVARIWRIGG